uniref:Uncharacterized protein n=1 Tax=Arundo donax TaxID=35708 RepID=A0A0A8XPW5_ARUDO
MELVVLLGAGCQSLFSVTVLVRGSGNVSACSSALVHDELRLVSSLPCKY